MTFPIFLVIVVLFASLGFVIGKLTSDRYWRREIHHAKRQADTERFALYRRGEDARDTAYHLQRKLDAAYDLIAVLQVRLRR
jgi:hypothetical protein